MLRHENNNMRTEEEIAKVLDFSFKRTKIYRNEILVEDRCVGLDSAYNNSVLHFYKTGFLSQLNKKSLHELGKYFYYTVNFNEMPDLLIKEQYFYIDLMTRSVFDHTKRPLTHLKTTNDNVLRSFLNSNNIYVDDYYDFLKSNPHPWININSLTKTNGIYFEYLIPQEEYEQMFIDHYNKTLNGGLFKIIDLVDKQFIKEKDHFSITPFLK